MRTVEEVQAEIDRLRQPVRDAAAEVERLQDVHKKALAEIEQARQAHVTARRAIQHRVEVLAAELRKLEGVAKLQRLEVGQTVSWQQSDGWRGTTSRRARIVRISQTKAQIELVSPYADEAKRRWVDPRSISIGA